MAYTRLSDLIVPEVYSDIVNEELNTNADRLIASGAVAQDGLLGAQLSGGFAATAGSSIILPSFKPWVADDVIGSDDPTDTITATARTEYSMKAVKQYRNFAFGAMDFARAEGSGDPMGTIVAQAAKNVMTNRQTALVQCLSGVEADNVANDDGDMVEDIVVATDTAPGASNRLSSDVIFDAFAQRGDFSVNETPALLVMHSKVFWQLMKDDKVTFERESGQLPVYTYAGVSVLVDDRVATAANSDHSAATDYVTYVLGAGAVRFATSGVSAAVDRDETIGNGSGGEQLITRRTDIMHPEGFDWTASTDNPSNSNLAAASSWSRAYDRKNVGITFIKSNV